MKVCQKDTYNMMGYESLVGACHYKGESGLAEDKKGRRMDNPKNVIIGFKIPCDYL